MASTLSRLIPLAVLGIVALSIFAEVQYGVKINLESFLPLLVPLGIGGLGKSIFDQAVAARKALPSDIEDLIKSEIAKALPPKA